MFIISSIIHAPFYYTAQYEWARKKQERKKQQRIYDYLEACLLYTNQRKIFLQKKSFLRKSGSWGLKRNEKKAF